MKRGRVYNRVYTPSKWESVNKLNKNLIEDFLLEMKQQKKKESTISQYFNDLRVICIFILEELDNKYILELNKKHFRNISLWFSNDLGLSNSRVNRLMSAVRSMLDFAENDDDYDYDVNIAKKVKGLPKEDVRQIYFLTEEQIVKLREYLIEKEEYQKLVLLDLAYDSAGRRAELWQVKKDNLLGKSYTNEVIGKRGKRFKLLMFNRTQDSLELYFKQRGEDNIESLWVIGKGANRKEASYEVLYDWFVEMANILSKLEGKEILFNPHSLRHSSLQNLSNGTHYMCKSLGKTVGFELNQLKVFAHHESTDTTNNYLMNDDSEILAEMFNIKIE